MPLSTVSAMSASGGGAQPAPGEERIGPRRLIPFLALGALLMKKPQAGEAPAGH